MSMLKSLIERFRTDESGQGLVEYVLIIALVAVGLVAVITLFRNSIGKTFDNVTQTLNAAPGTQYTAS